MSMTTWLAVFLGGGLGSLLRYGCSLWLGAKVPNFPLATLTANTVACLLLGFLLGVLYARVGFSEEARAFWLIGVCGGFSTFSTFSNELFSLSRQHVGTAVLYLALSLILGIGGVVAGQFFGRWAAR